MAEPKTLRSREDVERALEALGKWELVNCRWDRDVTIPRYTAEHKQYGQVAAQSGPELVALVKAVEEAATELGDFELELNRGSPWSPTSAWWAGDVLDESASWASDLQDLLVIVRRARVAGRAEKKRKRTRKQPDATEAAPPAPLTRDTVDLATFTDQVLEVAAGAPPAMWFGSQKVYIAYLWQTLQGEWASREDFNEALLEANRSQRVSLTRADLVSAMDPATVAESEVTSYGATFHFIVVPAGASRG